MAFKIYLRAPGETRRPPAGMDAVIHLDEPGVAGVPLHHNLDRLWASPRPPSQEALSFLLAALGVWAGDKMLARKDMPDAWSRQFVLHLPGSSSCGPAAPLWPALLNFLTGDSWTLKLRETHVNLGLQGVWRPSWQPDGVALFSGGLDSLVGALDLLEAGQRLLLVSHHDFGQLASLQQSLAAALREHYGPEKVEHLSLRVQCPQAPELTLRSRSLLYLALGLAAAAGFSPEVPLTIPENGWVSLNPPLTLNRLGPYSTRTTHPHFLTQISTLWREVGLMHPLHNPYQNLSKGELLAQCRHRTLLKSLAPLTVSCARPVASRWHGGRFGSCGYCYPCLMRRAALHRLGWDEGEDYLLDVLAAPETLRHRVRGQHLRALLGALQTWQETPHEIYARLWWGGSAAGLPARQRQVQQVLAQGFEEIGALFRDKGSEWVKAYGDGGSIL